MGELSEHDRFKGGNIVENIDATARSAASFVASVQHSLDGIKDNTRRLNWWTTTLISVCMGLFILALLVRIRRELIMIIRYLEVFGRTWEEDRIEERERFEERKRERQERNRRTRGPLKYSRGGKGVQQNDAETSAQESNPYSPRGNHGPRNARNAAQVRGTFASGVDDDDFDSPPPGPAARFGRSGNNTPNRYNNALGSSPPRSSQSIYGTNPSFLGPNYDAPTSGQRRRMGGFGDEAGPSNFGPGANNALTFGQVPPPPQDLGSDYDYLHYQDEFE